MKHVRKLEDLSVQTFLRAREGVSALEYAILVAVIAVTLGAALVAFSGSMTTGMNTVGSTVGAFNPGPIPVASGALPVLGASVALAPLRDWPAAPVRGVPVRGSRDSMTMMQVTAGVTTEMKWVFQHYIVDALIWKTRRPAPLGEPGRRPLTSAARP